jgi:predicted ArsR family transcriptional regulator
MELALATHDSTRMRVLHLLKQRGKATVAELAEELKLSGVSLRRHLDLLEKDHLVAARIYSCGRGRPARLYQLTEQADRFFPQRYSQFVVSLLDEVRETFGRGAVEKVIRSYTDKLVERIRARLGGGPLGKRVEALAQAMTDLGFLASCEPAGRKGFFLTQLHCPLSRVAVACPALCEQELRMHEELLSARVTRQCFIPDGGEACRYLIQPRSASAKR